MIALKLRELWSFEVCRLKHCQLKNSLPWILLPFFVGLRRFFAKTRNFLLRIAPKFAYLPYLPFPTNVKKHQKSNSDIFINKLAQIWKNSANFINKNFRIRILVFLDFCWKSPIRTTCKFWGLSKTIFHLVFTKYHNSELFVIRMYSFLLHVEFEVGRQALHHTDPLNEAF